MGLRVALLRAVNVGGRKLNMTDLQRMFESLGFVNTRTILQSGNVIFDSAKTTSAALDTFLETETEKRLNFSTNYFVRTAEEWNLVLERNPFRHEAKDDPSHLLVAPMKATPSMPDVAALRSAIQGREIVQAAGRELYVYYPDGIGESKLTVALVERKLRTRCTGRNWNTALKIQAAMTDQDSAR